MRHAMQDDASSYKMTQDALWAKIINTSYQKLPFGSGDDPDKLFFFVFFFFFALKECG